MSELRRPRFPGGRNLIVGFLVVLASLLLLRWGTALYVDHLWYRAEGAIRSFWTRTIWEWGVRLLTGALTAIIVGLNLRPVARTFANLQIRRRFGDLVIQEKLPPVYLKWSVIGAALLVGASFAAAVPSGTGLQLLLAVHGPEVGTVDPVLHTDLGFYLFRLPALALVFTWALVVSIFAVLVVGAGYLISSRLSVRGGRLHAEPAVARHLGGLLALILLLVSLRVLLSPYILLADGSSGVQGIVGATDVRAVIPAYRIVAFLAFLTAAGAAWGTLRGRLLPGISGSVALLILSVAALQLYPAFVQRFQVQPNELVREREHIERAVAATRDGFGLGGLERERFPYRPPSDADWADASVRLARLPVWTEKTLDETFQQVEARFEYAGFAGVTFDRYRAGDDIVPVALAVREIFPEAIPQQTWQNLHLRENYVAGLGAVAGPANQQSPEGRMPTWLGAVSPELREGPGVPPGLRVERPQIHVGIRSQRYSVITPTSESFLAPDGSEGFAGVDFPEGIRVGSFPRRLALALRFQDANLLISGEIGADSRVVYRRDVVSRVRAIAPFLHLPEAPYAVIRDGRVVWIVEGFTASRRYPLAVVHAIDGRVRVNYLRNAVKATVDAVTGETRLYAADPTDPLLQGWRRAFPGLIRDMDELPAELIDHLRYSRWLMHAQVQVLLRYHQDDPRVFHSQQDRWAIPVEVPDASGPIPYRPEYALLTLPGDEIESWALSTVFIPAGRQNLASFLVGSWRPGIGGDLRLWDVPREDQVAGPRQVAALVEQDPVISEQFSLWRRGGSDVSTGHLYLVPVGSTLVYMEPVFLAAESNPIPEIRRYIVSDGRRVAMEPTLAGAVAALRGATDPGAPGPTDPDSDAAVDDVHLPERPEAAGSGAALELLEEAERRLRAGDWEGFGRYLRELRELLAREAGDVPPE